MYDEDLVLNNQQGLTYYKTKPNNQIKHIEAYNQ